MGRLAPRGATAPTEASISALGFLKTTDVDVVNLDQFATDEELSLYSTKQEANALPLPYTDRLSIPSLTKYPNLKVGDKTSVGLGTLYLPWMIRVPESVFAAYPAGGRWRIYTSTDHDSANGGIAIGVSSNVDPLVVSSWSWLRNSGSAVMFFDGTNNQTETPCVVWNPVTNLFHMYYQRKNGSTNQVTALATSPNGVTNWTIVGPVLPNLSNGIAGFNHTGYAKVFYLDGLWCAWHLKGSGSTVVDGYGWSFSHDGVSWIQDRRRVAAGVDMTDGVLRFGISSLFHWRGDVWALGTGVNEVSGGTNSTSIRVWVAPINLSDDLRSLRGRPQFLPWSVQSPETSLSGPPPAFATMNDGRLVGAMRTNGDNGFLSLVVMA